MRLAVIAAQNAHARDHRAMALALDAAIARIADLASGADADIAQDTLLLQLMRGVRQNRILYEPQFMHMCACEFIVHV